MDLELKEFCFGQVYLRKKVKVQVYSFFHRVEEYFC